MEKKYYYGLVFLVIQLITIARNLIDGYNYYFWFCDFAPILFSIAFFIGNKDFVKGIINFGLIPQLIFAVDFIYALNIGVSPLGITYLASKLSFFSIWSTILTHLTTSLAFLFTFRIKPNKKTLIYSTVILIAVYVLMLTLTSPQDDVNYVYSTGNLLKSFNFAIPNIVLLWPFLTFLLLVIPTQVIQYISYRLFKKGTERTKK